MFDPDDHNEARRPRSLLSLNQPTPAEPARVRPGSLLSVAVEETPERPHMAAAPTERILEDAPVSQARPQSARMKSEIPEPRRHLGDTFRARWTRRSDEKPAPDHGSEPVAAADSPRHKQAETHERGSLREAGPVPPRRSYRMAVEPPEREDDLWRPLIDPMLVIRGITGSKGLLAGMTVLGAVAGALIALSIPKMYSATAEVLVDPRDLAIFERDLMAGGSLPTDATLAIVENQVQVLKSGNVLNKVVDRLNLTEDPEFTEETGSFAIGTVITKLRLLLSTSPGGGTSSQRRLVVRNLSNSVDVYREGKTFVISISAETKDPEKSAQIANTLTDVFLETQGELQAGAAGRATDELTSRLDELRKGVEAAERAVEKFKAEHDIVGVQGRLITDDEIVRLNEQLTIARARTIELNARAASASALNVNAVLEGSLPELMASAVMTELRAQYASTKQEADRLAVRLGPRHPQRAAAEAQLAGAREQLQAELRRIVSSIQVEQKRAAQLEQDLSSRLAQLKVRQANLSGELVTLRELERDVTSKRSVYEAFLLRSRETGEQQSLNTANVSVISQAFPPLLPTGPSRMVITLAGAVLGFFAGIGIGGVRGAWDSLRQSGSIRDQRRPAARPAPAAYDQAAFRRSTQATEPELGHLPGNRVSEPHDARPFDDIREELRQFREAVRDLAESRARHRHDT